MAAAAPTRPALIQGPRVVSYRDFDRRANALARRMLEAGVSHQSKVGAYLYNAPEYLESYFAAFKAGLAPFNINYRYGGEELTYLLDNADAEVVVFHASFAATADKVRGGLPKVKLWLAVPEAGHPVPDWAEDYEAIASAGAERAVAPWGRSGDDILMMYTGGTTGMPKGVMWRQEDLFKSLGGGANLLLGLGPLETLAEAGERVKAVVASGAPQAVTMAVAPLMHATAQYTSLGAAERRDRRGRAAVAQVRRCRAVRRSGPPGGFQPDHRWPGLRRPDAGDARRQPGPLEADQPAGHRLLGHDVERREQAGPAQAHAPGDADGLPRLLRGAGPRRLDGQRRRPGPDRQVRGRRQRGGVHRGRPAGPARVGRTRPAGGRRPHAGRLLQGRGEVGEDLPGLRGPALLRARRLGDGRGRRDHHPAGPRARR